MTHRSTCGHHQRRKSGAWLPPWMILAGLCSNATLLKRETSWAHIVALQTVILKYGLPYCYYVDSHSIFRFVQGRDSVWRDQRLVTDEADPQWKQVLKDLNVKVTYALSPQAKGKIEKTLWMASRQAHTDLRTRECP